MTRREWDELWVGTPSADMRPLSPGLVLIPGQRDRVTSVDDCLE